jgi:hypothetical protein
VESAKAVHRDVAQTHRRDEPAVRHSGDTAVAHQLDAYIAARRDDWAPTQKMCRDASDILALLTAPLMESWPVAPPEKLRLAHLIQRPASIAAEVRPASARLPQVAQPVSQGMAQRVRFRASGRSAEHSRDGLPAGDLRALAVRSGVQLPLPPLEPELRERVASLQPEEQ